LQGFDYTMSLDTDSYFPAPLQSDPIWHMHNNSDLVYGTNDLIETSDVSNKNLWEFTALYAYKHGINLSDSTFHSGPRVAENMHFARRLFPQPNLSVLHQIWNGRVVMTDWEIVRLSFFRKGTRYWDYFSFLDSLAGFWLHRWGGHAIRALGVGIALWEEDRATWASGQLGRGNPQWPRIFTLEPWPYAHQKSCRCGDADRTQKCQADLGPQMNRRSSIFWTCIREGEGDHDRDIEIR